MVMRGRSIFLKKTLQQLNSRNVRIIHTRFTKPPVVFGIKPKLSTIYKRNCCEYGFPKPDEEMFDDKGLFLKALEYIPTYGFTRDCLEKAAQELELNSTFDESFFSSNDCGMMLFKLYAAKTVKDALFSVKNTHAESSYMSNDFGNLIFIKTVLKKRASVLLPVVDKVMEFYISVLDHDDKISQIFYIYKNFVFLMLDASHSPSKDIEAAASRMSAAMLFLDAKLYDLKDNMPKYFDVLDQTIEAFLDLPGKGNSRDFFESLAAKDDSQNIDVEE
ncbi:hypothetical protein RF11_14433 [Thelohanellus kitauei]|uniref:Uncharacterized protein n=1 Tax=Thelohanellus kitauei TaxID=669202 RepID=A0A0C2M578_THEKT|nr:hypothetical protein RF11_14433 [Thelohanellus kitauei]